MQISYSVNVFSSLALNFAHSLSLTRFFHDFIVIFGMVANAIIVIWEFHIQTYSLLKIELTTTQMTSRYTISVTVIVEAVSEWCLHYDAITWHIDTPVVIAARLKISSGYSLDSYNILSCQTLTHSLTDSSKRWRTVMHLRGFRLTEGHSLKPTSWE